MKKVLAGILVLFIAGICFLNILGDGQSGRMEQRYIVLGDGRAAELTAFAHDEDNIEFITKSGADIEWLDEEALPDGQVHIPEDLMLTLENIYVLILENHWFL